MKISVLVAGGTDVVRAGVTTLINLERNMSANRVVPELRAGLLPRSQRKSLPDVAVVLQGRKEAESIKRIVRSFVKRTPGCGVVLVVPSISGYAFDWARESGAMSCISESCTAAQLVKAVSSAASSEPYFPRPAKGNAKRRRHDIQRLTPRERQVLQALTSGRNTKEAADALGVSPKTVETHRLHIMTKVDYHSLPDLTRLAVREGLTPLDD